MTAELTAKKQRGRPFDQGRSGNPSGRPKGARNRVTVLAEKLMSEGVEELVSAVLSAAKSGNMAAARLIFDRIIPIRRGSPVNFDLPPFESDADLAVVFGAVLKAVAGGTLTPDEALSVANLLEMKRTAILRAESQRQMNVFLKGLTK